MVKEKIQEWKRLWKDGGIRRWVILFLVGALLVVIAMPMERLTIGTDLTGESLNGQSTENNAKQENRWAGGQGTGTDATSGGEGKAAAGSVTAYEQELNRKLLTQAQRSKGYHWEFDMDTVLRADASTQAEVDYKGVRSGWELVDEIRARRGKAPLPGGIGQQALVSQDLATLEYTVKDKPGVLSGKNRDPGEEPA